MVSSDKFLKYPLFFLFRKENISSFRLIVLHRKLCIRHAVTLWQIIHDQHLPFRGVIVIMPSDNAK